MNLYDPFQKIDDNGKKIPGPGSYHLEKETIAQRSLEKLT